MDVVLPAFQAARAQHLMEFFEGIIEATGHTFQQRTFGVSGVGTIEPKNIEAILSTQFTGQLPCAFHE